MTCYENIDSYKWHFLGFNGYGKVSNIDSLDIQGSIMMIMD